MICLLKTGRIFAFLKLSGNSFDIHDLSKIIVCDTTMTSASTLGCFPPGPMHLYGLRFLKRSMTQSASTTGNLMTQRLGRLCWWKLRQIKHGVLQPHLRLQSLAQPPHSAMGHIFHVYSFTTNVAVKDLLASLDVPCKCRLRVSFGFPNIMPTCHCNVSKFLFHSPFLFLLLYTAFLHWSSIMGYLVS